MITLQSADVVAPEPCLLSKRNVAGVEIERHGALVPGVGCAESQGVSEC